MVPGCLKVGRLYHTQSFNFICKIHAPAIHGVSSPHLGTRAYRLSKHVHQLILGSGSHNIYHLWIVPKVTSLMKWHYDNLSRCFAISRKTEFVAACNMRNCFTTIIQHYCKTNWNSQVAMILDLSHLFLSECSGKKIHTSLQIGHFDFGSAALGPSKSSTEAAEQAHPLQNRWPQLRAQGLKTVSCPYRGVNTDDSN